MSERIGVIGAGAWGSALALSLARTGHNVVLWGHEATHIRTLHESRRNELYLPGITLPQNIAITVRKDDLKECVLYLAVVPAKAMLACLKNLSPSLNESAPLVLCAKGFDYESGAFLSDQVETQLPLHAVGVLSGPSFAIDVANGLPTAVSLAFKEPAIGEKVAGLLQSKTFRPYLSADVRGVEIGGALKNVLAIAAGIVMGKKLGVSARAALIARGFAEMQRFGLAYGARPETFSGLSGLGDLILTATSEQSRNLRFGIALGEGKNIAKAQEGLSTVEGIAAAQSAMLRAKEKNVDMPIMEAVVRVLEETESIDQAIARLMMRPLRGEQ
jgi:glycerol-3-phosphate dehydrogenase (NAD(P)+)